MATRSSARIRSIPAQAQINVEQSVRVDAVKNKKSRSTSDSTAGNATKRRKIEHQQGSSVSSLPNKDLTSLPDEIVEMIVHGIKDVATISKLGRTCRRLYSITIPALYERVAVAAPYHAHIAKLIRTLEPHLTIAQKKQLKKEGKYKGQQERHSTKIDPNLKPECADQVRQLIVGYSDPGRKHQFIVDRYVEEAFKNMSQLEIVETHLLTDSVADSIASLRNLKALCIDLESDKTPDITPLRKVGNLKHLNIKCVYGSADIHTTIQSLLVKSRSTLRSLEIQALAMWEDAPNFWTDWDKAVPNSQKTSHQSHDLTALKSLTLSHITFTPAQIESSKNAIDFFALHELNLRRLSTGNALFFQHLASLGLSAMKSPSSIRLRNLFIDMSDSGSDWRRAPDEKQIDLDAKCRFISSFDTLTTLVLNDYNQYSAEITVNPGIPDELLQAVFKHRNLKVLKLPYKNGFYGNCKIPYLSAKTVATIIDNLPELQAIEFAPEQTEIDEIAKALSKGKNLTSIRCYPYASAHRPDGYGYEILHPILREFLSHYGASHGRDFAWEDHVKVKTVSDGLRTWNIASKFDQPKKGARKEKNPVTQARIEELRNPHMLSHGGQEVWYQCDWQGRFDKDSLYLPAMTWVDEVAKDIHN